MWVCYVLVTGLYLETASGSDLVHSVNGMHQAAICGRGTEPCWMVSLPKVYCPRKDTYHINQLVTDIEQLSLETMKTYQTCSTLPLRRVCHMLHCCEMEPALWESFTDFSDFLNGDVISDITFAQVQWDVPWGCWRVATHMDHGLDVV